jgi:hypothetical protein
MQFHDPHELISAVQEHLRAQGRPAEITDSTAALVGACSLLRGLGLTPAIDAVDAYARADTAGPWADADDARAARTS